MIPLAKKLQALFGVDLGKRQVFLISTCQLSNSFFSVSGYKTMTVSWGRISPLASDLVVVQHRILFLSSEPLSWFLSLPCCHCQCEGHSGGCPSFSENQEAACMGSFGCLEDAQRHMLSSCFMSADALCVSPDSCICSFRKHLVGVCTVVGA